METQNAPIIGPSAPPSTKKRREYLLVGGRRTRLWQSKHEVVGGSVKRSLAMALLRYSATVAKACGLDTATHASSLPFEIHFLIFSQIPIRLQPSRNSCKIASIHPGLKEHDSWHEPTQGKSVLSRY